MSTNSSPRRCTRSNFRVPKMDLTNSRAARVSRAAAVGGGGAGAPINVDSDDEIQLLSSPRGFPQTRNQPRRRNRPVIVVVDEERETRPGTLGASTIDLETLSSTSSSRKRARISPNKKIINCESDSLSEESAKRKRTGKAVPEKEIPKEPVFSCPICMGTLTFPCSTPCGHIFCEGCIKAALQVQKKCPTCRSKLTMKNNFHKVYLPTTA